MCIGLGIPAILGRWEEQSSNGIMWKDIGLEKWFFDFDKEDDIKRYVPTVLEMVKNNEAAKRYATKARTFVFKKYKGGMRIIGDCLRKEETQRLSIK